MLRHSSIRVRFQTCIKDLRGDSAGATPKSEEESHFGNSTNTKRVAVDEYPCVSCIPTWLRVPYESSLFLHHGTGRCHTPGDWGPPSLRDGVFSGIRMEVRDLFSWWKKPPVFFPSFGGWRVLIKTIQRKWFKGAISSYIKFFILWLSCKGMVWLCKRSPDALHHPSFSMFPPLSIWDHWSWLVPPCSMLFITISSSNSWPRSRTISGWHIVFGVVNLCPTRSNGLGKKRHRRKIINKTIVSHLFLQ